MGCFDTSGRTLWGVYAVMLLSGLFFVCTSQEAFRQLIDADDPNDFSISLRDHDSFTGCAHCVQDFANEVLKSVNVTYGIMTFANIHKRNQKLYLNDPFPRKRRNQDPEIMCITQVDIQRDIDRLFEEFEGFKFPEWEEECKELCIPVMRAIPWAMAVGATLLFFGLTCITCSGLPLCILLCTCCCKSKTPAPAQLIVAATASVRLPTKHY